MFVSTVGLCPRCGLVHKTHSDETPCTNPIEYMKKEEAPPPVPRPELDYALL